LKTSLAWSVITMQYDDLVHFIQHGMRMSHIYQPVMITTLLKNKGRCSATNIAKSLLLHDSSQIEYYERITRDMVGRVLRNHGLVTREGKEYRLVGYESLSKEQRAHLIDLCKSKLDEYVEKRGERIFQHRRKSVGYVSGTLRYDVLKRAKFRCELCGIAADEKALEVDHIVPRNRGGLDDISNLQALCYSCNAMKRDRDDTDFRKVKASYTDRQPDCLFCAIPSARIIKDNALAYAVYDAYPVTEHHALVIPRRHVPTYFDLSRPEINACNLLLEGVREMVNQADDAIAGYNIGINDGEAAGQSIFHCHLHLIPRRQGDVDDPRGGVRHIIAGKGYY
jgi:diadenosine tetraphosphate (Ap4A) HIT family hydrolase